MPFDPDAALTGGFDVPAPWTPPTIFTAREICEQADPDTPILLGSPTRGPLLRHGDRLIVGAGTGAGKTTICMRIIRAVVLQEKFLEWRGQLEDAHALVLDLEQGRRSIKRSLRQAGLDESDRVDYVPIPDGLSLDRNEQQQAWLYDEIERRAPAVVMFDPLYKLHDGDANDEQAMVRLMKMIDGWRTTLGFALLVPAHLRKADKTGRSKPTIDDVAGSGVLTRGAEVVLGLELVSGIPEGSDAIGQSRLYFWKDRDGDLPVGSEWMLSFKPDPVGYTRNEDATLSGEQLVIKRLAAAFPEGHTAEALAKLMERSKRTVQRYLKEIRMSGTPELREKVGRDGRTIYSLAELVDDEEIAAWEAAAGDTLEDDA